MMKMKKEEEEREREKFDCRLVVTEERGREPDQSFLEREGSPRERE